MSGEVEYAKQLVNQAMGETCSDKNFDKDTVGRAIINTVLENFCEYRSVKDIVSEMEYLIENLGQDEFVITRGC
ncbi:MAG: hypothetical protein ACRBCS_09530 [Cellvibrionaceae bacterium]